MPSHPWKRSASIEPSQTALRTRSTLKCQRYSLYRLCLTQAALDFNAWQQSLRYRECLPAALHPHDCRNEQPRLLNDLAITPATHAWLPQRLERQRLWAP